MGKKNKKRVKKGDCSHIIGPFADISVKKPPRRSKSAVTISRFTPAGLNTSDSRAYRQMAKPYAHT